MIEQGTDVVEVGGSITAPSPNPDVLAYDFFKHMTNLTVLTLGGMVTLFGSIFSEVEAARAMLPIAVIAASGLIAFIGQLEMMERAYRDAPLKAKMTRFYRLASPVLFFGGVGSFLAVAAEKLS